MEGLFWDGTKLEGYTCHIGIPSELSGMEKQTVNAKKALPPMVDRDSYSCDIFNCPCTRTARPRLVADLKYLEEA